MAPGGCTRSWLIAPPFYAVGCGRKRVARLLRAAGLVGVCRRRKMRTTQRDALAPISDDLVQRRFPAAAPDRLGVADIPDIPTMQRILSLGVILDACSRRVVGWAMADHLRTELVEDALRMAVQHRRPAAGLIPHSDHGWQYTSLACSRRCREAGIAQSMPSR
jgi:putative transposase